MYKLDIERPESNGFTFESIQPRWFENTPSDHGLLITYANRIPPHIGFCHNGIYYALSNHGESKPQALNKVLRMIDLKKIPSLFVHLSNPTSSPSQESIGNLLKAAPSFTEGGTCLHPVKGMIETYWNIQIEKPLIHGLLSRLEEFHLIKEAKIRHLETVNQSEKHFTIPAYDENAVKNHLRQLISTG
jgi:hypothetical protein